MTCIMTCFFLFMLVSVWNQQRSDNTKAYFSLWENYRLVMISNFNQNKKIRNVNANDVVIEIITQAQCFGGIMTM